MRQIGQAQLPLRRWLARAQIAFDKFFRYVPLLCRIIAVGLGIWAAFGIDGWSAPIVIKASAWLFDALAVVALLRVDWTTYWRELPLRVARAGFEALLNLAFSIVLGAAAALLWWWGNEWGMALKLLAAICGFYAVALLLTGAALSSWGLIFGLKDQNNPLDRVAGQTTYGDARHANVPEVDAALRGGGGGRTAEPQFED